MVVDKAQGGGDQKCFNCGGFGHMAQNCATGKPIDRNGRVIWSSKGEEKEEELKDNRGQYAPNCPPTTSTVLCQIEL